MESKKSTEVTQQFWAAVIFAVFGLSFMFGWNISCVNPARKHFSLLYNDVTYSDYYDSNVVAIMAIGAIIGSVLSGTFRSKFGPAGSMIYISLINIAGCLLIYYAYQNHPRPDFKNDPQYPDTLLELYKKQVNKKRIAVGAEEIQGISEADMAKDYKKIDDHWYFFDKKKADLCFFPANDTCYEGFKNTPKYQGYSHETEAFKTDGFPANLKFLAMGRLLNGIFVGLASAMAPNYIMEISPKDKQGMIGVLNQLLITVGILVANLAAFSEEMESNSLYFFMMPVVFNLIFLIGFFMGQTPESPKFLYMDRNDRDKAEENLSKFRRNSIDIDNELNEYQKEKEASNSEQELSFVGIFNYPGIKWQVFTLIFMHVAQPMSGINAVFFYSDQIFENVGVADNSLSYYSTALSALNVAMTVISVKIIESAGRKMILFGGYTVSTACTFLLVLAIKNSWASFSLLALLGFIAGFAIGPGPVPWIYNSELFPTNARSATGTLGCVTNWFVNFLVSKYFNIIRKQIHENVFVIFVIFSIVTVLYCWKIVPETKNRNSNQIFNDFAKLNGVEKLPDEDEEKIQLKGNIA